MTEPTLQTFGAVAGVGGLSLGVLLFVFRDVIRKNIFPQLSQLQAYRLIRLIVILTFAISIVGLIAWLMSTRMGSGQSRGAAISLPQAKNIHVLDLQSQYPLVRLAYPGDWFETNEEGGSPELKPKTTSPFAALGVRVRLFPSRIDLDRIKYRMGADAFSRTFKGHDTLTSLEHLRFIKGSGLPPEILLEESESITWLGERSFDLPIHSDLSDQPARKTLAESWLIDTKEGESRKRTLYFFEQGSLYREPNTPFNTLEIVCEAPAVNFPAVSSICNEILESITISSQNYFAS